VYRHNEDYLAGKQANLSKNLVSSLAEDSLVTVIDSLLYIFTLQRWYKNLSLSHLLCALSLIYLM
jgi:hypothetical protein